MSSPYAVTVDFFFFKQKTAYEIWRDWSSDVCSSDLQAIGRRPTSIDFAENQLFPSLIGLSPLAAAHPRLFQQAWVRPSSGCYPTFSLAAARSLGFGSPAGDWTRPSHSLSLRLRLAAQARRRRELADPLYKRYAVTPPRLRTG